MYSRFFIISVLFVWFISCSDNSTDPGGDPEPSTEYQIELSASPNEGGSTSGAGTFEEGDDITVEASASSGYNFVDWTEDGSQVSREANYTFRVQDDRDLVANFEKTSQTQTYDIVLSASPSEGGSVSGEGTYEEGEDITVEATPSSSYNFVNWTEDGSQVSSQSNFSFTVNEDRSLVANFEQNQKAFSHTITVTDGNNTFEITFGMDENASIGFDQGVDEEAPPEPPAGAFYVYFDTEGNILVKDYRVINNSETVWAIKFAPEEGLNMNFQWDFSQSQHVGDLTLTDDPNDPSFEMNMKTINSYEVTDSKNTLYVISN